MNTLPWHSQHTSRSSYKVVDALLGYTGDIERSVAFKGGMNRLQSDNGRTGKRPTLFLIHTNLLV